MRVIPDQDERDLAAMCRSVLAAELEPDAQWKALADAGVLGLADRRQPADLTDLGVFCVEAGRALCPRVVHEHGVCGSGRRLARRAEPRLAASADFRRARATTALFNPRDASDVTPRCRRDATATAGA